MTASSTLTAPIETAPAAPAHLPLHDWHVAHGARMEPFAGWAMPLQYSLGILGEHRHTRSAASLFDVSHMGQILVRPRGTDPLPAALALESLIPIDVVGLPPGRQRYGFFTTPSGGLYDDLMIANLGSAWLLVVNAASAAQDLAYLKANLGEACVVELVPDRGLLALQGPAAVTALAAAAPAAAHLRFMDVALCEIAGAECWVSRSGYTGEDGFELSVPTAKLESIATQLLEQPAVTLAGLGARDSLRLEAGLCLYGHDIDLDTTPVEAALEWAIPRVRRSLGARAGGFPGSDLIFTQLARGVSRRRVGLTAEGRPVRAGAALFADATASLALGVVTSGSYGPSAGAPVAMGYLPTALATPGQRLSADIRGQRVPVTIAGLPFVPHRYQR